MLRSVNRGLHVRGPFRFRHYQPGRKNQIFLVAQRGNSPVGTGEAMSAFHFAARHTGVSMSRHLRSCFAACVLLAGLSTSPASSSPFDFLFNAAPAEATAPRPAEEECLPHPGKSTDGQHWVYRFDGHRKCWFQVADEVATAKKAVHHRAAKQRVAAPEESEAAPRKRKGVVDARAELLRSAPAETPQQTPDFKVADATAEAAALVPAVPVVAKPATDQLTPDNPTPRP